MKAQGCFAVKGSYQPAWTFQERGFDPKEPESFADHISIEKLEPHRFVCFFETRN
jgi:hypothetical protein